MSGTAGRPMDSANDGLDLGRIAGAFRRHGTLFVTTVIAVSAATAALLTQLAPLYTASAVLVVEPREMRVFETKTVAEGLSAWQPGNDGPLATQVNILTSRSHARRVVEKLRLTDADEFKPQPGLWQDPRVVALRELARSLGLSALETVARYFGPGIANGSAEPRMEVLTRFLQAAEPMAHIGTPTASAVEAAHDPDEVAVDRLLGRLDVYREGVSQAIVVRYSATEPQLAAAVTNAVVDLYLEGQIEEKVRATDAAEAWVGERIVALRDGLLEAERRVERYRAGNDLLESADGSLEAQQLASLNAQLIDARAERQVAEAKLRRVREIQAKGGDYQALPEVADTPMIAQLRQQVADLERSTAQLSQEYGVQHPRMLQVQAEREEVRRKLAVEVARIVARIDDDVAFAAARERAIAARLEEAKGASAGARNAAVELHELERDAAARRGVYEMVLARQQEIQEQRDLLEADARMLSRAAVPDAPSFPKPRIIMSVGFAGSIGLAVLFVMLAELADRTLRSGRQIEEQLGLHNLALVPAIGRLRRGSTPAHYLTDRPASAFAEAHREVELAQQGPCPADRKGRVLLVTSSLPGEGKSTFATCLALTAAGAGRRTVVVDLDLRHPSVEPALGLARTSGLTEHLVNGRSLDMVTVTVPYAPNLHVIGNTSSKTGRTDLARSARLAKMIDTLREKYDLIVVDTAPLLGLADTKVVVGLADEVIFVVRWGATPAAAARNAVQALRGLKASIAGAVLTQVDLRRHARYGYADAGAYYKHYRKYYVN